LDAIYQSIKYQTFDPVEALIVALGLGFLTYVLLRDPAASISYRWHRHTRNTTLNRRAKGA